MRPSAGEGHRRGELCHVAGAERGPVWQAWGGAVAEARWKAGPV